MGQGFLSHVFFPGIIQTMKNSVRKALYILLVIFMVLSFYAIFNAGNPASLFRFIVKDTSYDIVITVTLSLVVAVLVILLSTGRNEGSLRHLLQINADHIRELRRKGKNDDYIANSFLSSLGGKKGIIYSLAKRRILRYLSRLE